ncbi:hypothetical protein QWY31_13430 [Cytophagales bacterium LB-30]|uniref:Lipoprotein n=1 Tax=Shiella aurantiaca TaxID=3058365 RepID=A0ABT8F970_9BACT|nr:hypothetical protein [Shiella aurantiaca]MDN4166506.1 hypothetical protein [Shiella aurantiaca]
MNKLFLYIVGLIFLSSCGWWCDDCDSNEGVNNYHYINDTSDTVNITLFQANDYSSTPPASLSTKIPLHEIEILPGNTLISEENANDFGPADFFPFGLDKPADSVVIMLKKIDVSVYNYSCLQRGTDTKCEIEGNPLNKAFYEITENDDNNILYTYRFSTYFGN